MIISSLLFILSMASLWLFRRIGRRNGTIQNVSMLPLYQPGMRYYVDSKKSPEVGLVMLFVVSPEWDLPYDFIIKKIEKIDVSVISK